MGQKPTCGGRPRIDTELRALIRQMSIDNRCGVHPHSWRTGKPLIENNLLVVF
jgi:hypothetical protein